MFFLDIGIIESYWRELLLHICQPIYKMIVYLYELFEVVGTAEILTSKTLTTIYGRIGMLLGIYMLFRIIFSFIQMLVNPDYISDKEKGVGKIASKAILTILLLAITPYLFNKAFEIQNYVVGAGNINNNVIAKLIFVDKVPNSGDFGPYLTAYLFKSFYRYDDGLEVGNPNRDCEALEEPNNGTQESINNNLHNSIVRSKGSVAYARVCLIDHGTGDNKYVSTYTSSNNEVKYKISFTWNGVFAIIVGLVVCYTLLMYTIMAGVRVIQLAFLRIISPMAILTYLSPKKDTMFSKWLKMCTTTYLDLFIRMAIIYFTVFIIQTIISGDGVALNNDGYEYQWIVNVVMIVALLMFAKKAPELLKELIPSTGGAASLGFGLKSPKKMFDSMLGGAAMYKGLSSVGKKIKKAPGNFARQTMGRVDVLRHGGTWSEAKVKFPGYFGRKKINWMKENAPLAYKSYENKIAGNQELADMHSNWVKGEALRRSLVSKYGGTEGFNSNKWYDVFNGSDSNKKYYEDVYKSKEFAESTRALDYAKEKMKVFSAVHAGLSTGQKFGTLKNSLSKDQIEMVKSMYAIGTNIDDIDATAFNAVYEKQQKIVSATEKTHDSLRKVHSKDAAIEDQISFRKNNDIDPTGRR